MNYRVDLKKRDSLIIFDEVQLCPKARQAIKFLVKDGRYDYIETGSLISIKKNVEKILIPSEERKVMMYPMDYEEFLWALGDTTTTGLLKKMFDSKMPIGDATHRKIMRDFRLYMLVGGMPQAVSEFLETNNFRLVDAVKRDILNLYEDDFWKIDDTGRLSKIFNAIPAQLSNNASRYQVSSILPTTRAEAALPLIARLEDSKTVLLSYNSNDPNVGLSSTVDLEHFKMFLCDTGLFTTLYFKDKDFTENVIYEKLLNDKLSANLGYLYENITAQTLAANGVSLYYHTFQRENSTRNYEIDFLLSGKNKISPVEVKSSGYKTHSSIDAFSKKYSSRISQKYLFYTKDLRVESDIIYLPFYLVQFIR